MVLVKKWPFFSTFFLGNIGKGNVFYDILEQKKNLSRPRKQEVKIVEKLTTFTKELSVGFCPKIPIIPTCFFRQYRQGKCLSRYSRMKKRLPRL